MSETAPLSVYLVGAGRMGGALLKGWLQSGWSAGAIFVKEPHPSPEMQTLIGENSLAAVPSGPPDVLVFAVKPQILDDILADNAAFAGPNTVVLSVAAGRTLASISRYFSNQTAVVRAMPNLPAEIGRGITALCANDATSTAQKQACERAARAVGEVIWLHDEALMDAVTAVSGSGPAYVFALVEALARAGEAAGIPEALAMTLARTTVTGAGELLSQSALSAAELRQNVTSPNGVTAAGLSVLLGNPGLEDLLIKTVAAAAARSKDLSK